MPERCGSVSRFGASDLILAFEVILVKARSTAFGLCICIDLESDLQTLRTSESTGVVNRDIQKYNVAIRDSGII